MSNVAVVGGGLVGASAAYRLLKRGAQVTVIDSADPGQATRAGAGILPPLDHFIGVDAVLPLLRAARAFYPELLRDLAADGQHDTGYDVVGALHVATDDEEAAKLGEVLQECEERRAAGFDQIGAVTHVDGAEARRLFPALGPAVLGAVHSTGAARVDGRRLAAALEAAILGRGGRWVRGRAELGVVGERVTVSVNGDSIEADSVVVAGGAWSRVLVEALQLELPVRPQRGQLIHLELPGVSTSRWPIVVGFGTSYLLSFPESRIVVGATRESEAGYDYRPTAGGVHAVLANALQVAPELGSATLLETRIGFRPLSADGKPILGVSVAYPNLFFATGHGGYGLEVGPYSGALVADLVVGLAAPIDLRPFALERFH